MPRLSLFPISAFTIALAAFALQSCKSQPQAVAVPAGSSKDIVVLADGATIVAPEGSRDRAMTDWLKAAEAAPARFSLGSDMFKAGSAELSRQGLGDAAKLATLLRATPDARVALLGGAEVKRDAAPNFALAQRRRETLAAFLKDRGIASDRVELSSREMAAESDPADVELVAKRGTSLEPVLASNS
ncbi:outer membrane protein OmpA-like peptidoglycan-associated protein [Sphingopyxis sp. OAS728]|uniref:hypothetical protein n=1 Tax=Sphingopyxis sp. OAS728 TaxID=2663823 RepID=UPI00178A025A|nr:hypothetical protein [Sphingopyxis sp. OAS728]MBE1529889.1 outer membrane protein OmpA-like peptidoglycan-associated protein [Sphingopyxis sp. OAS728]